MRRRVRTQTRGACGRAQHASTRGAQARGACTRAEHASTRGAQTRGAFKRAERASTRARGRALQPAVRSGLSLLVRAHPEIRGSVPRWRRARRRSSGHRASPAPKDSRQALEPQPGRIESYRCTGLCCLVFFFSERRARLKNRKNHRCANTKQIRRKRNTYRIFTNLRRMCRKNQNQSSMNDFRRLSDNAVLSKKSLSNSYKCPSTVNERAQKDIVSSVSFDGAQLQKNHTPLE